MKKIESLTPQQEQAMLAYRAKWLAIGRSTEPANRPAAEKAITRMYELLGHAAPRFWWSDGPAVGSIVRTLITSEKKGENLGANLWANLRTNLGTNLGANLRANLGANLWANLAANLRANLWDNLRTNLLDNLGANLGANLRDNLGDNLGANLGANLGDNLWANLRDNLGDNLRANLGANLGANLRDNLGANLGANLRDNASWHNWGSHEAHWPAYYNWPDAELRKMFSDSDREKLALWLTLAEGTGWWEPYQNVVFMCERPSIQLVDSNGRLHCETGPALLCRDGWPLWMLHGVGMTEVHVMTPAEKLNPIDILKESNVDIRRELIRKVGIEMMLTHLPHESLDKKGDYELLKIDFPGLAQDTRYLKMLNPSIGVWHLEGVERDCNSVQEAINWRAGVFGKVEWNPSQLT